MFAMPGKLSALFTLYNVERWFGLLGGTLLLLFTIFADPWFGLPPTAWHCLGLVLLMAVWWATEAVPLPVTALLPIIFLPMLGTPPSIFSSAASCWAWPWKNATCTSASPCSS